MRGKKNPNYKHGMYKSRLYKIWEGMKTRCGNPKTPKYSDYGAIGIFVCSEWLEFGEFMHWALRNGYSEELSIDRIDNEKGYYPDNCRWATSTTQVINQRMKKSNTSGYVGVSSFNGGRWRASIRHGGKRHHLGIFLSAKEAAAERDKFILSLNLPHPLAINR